MNRLSVLLGLPPADLTTMLGTSPIPVPPPDLALGIPADLLRQRPDVRRAERDLAAQCEEIGIAVADLYPHISLNGTIFVNSEKFSNLFTPKGWGGAVGPAFRWDILNYGRLQANIRIQEARFNELIYVYQHKVLTANEEVENSIASIYTVTERENAFQTGSTASVDAVEIGTKRYKDGVSDFNRLSNLQVVLAQQQDSLAFSQGQIAQSWVDVYRSLGGGWQIRLADALPYKPGISLEPGTESLPAPDPTLSTPLMPDAAPTSSPQTSVTSPQQVARSEQTDSNRPKPTIMSRLTIVKNFLLHRKAVEAKLEPQIAQIPSLEFPSLITPEGIEREADWSDLEDTSWAAPSEKRYSRTASEARTNSHSAATTTVPLQPRVLCECPPTESVIEIARINPNSRTASETRTNSHSAATTTVPSQPRVLCECPPTESVIEIARINPKSSNRLEACTVSQPLAVDSNAEQEVPRLPSQFLIVFSNNQSAPRAQEFRNSSAEPLEEFAQSQSSEVPPSLAAVTNDNVEKPRILKSQYVPQQQLATTPITEGDVPNITFNRQTRSSRRLNVLDPKYTR